MCHRQMFLTLGSFVATVAAVILVSLISEFAQPFDYGKTFTETTCTYVTANLTGQNVCCTPSCTFTYPCAHVTVSYTVQGSTAQGYLRSDYETVSRQASGSICAKYACKVTSTENLATVQAYVTSVTNQTFSCHYNPASTGEVIQIHVSATPVIHSVLWPSLFLIAGLVLVGLTRIQRLTCWRDDAKPGDDDDDDDDDKDDKEKIIDMEAGENQDIDGVEDEATVENGECSNETTDEQQSSTSVKDISQSKPSMGGNDKAKPRPDTAVSSAQTTTTTVSHA